MSNSTDEDWERKFNKAFALMDADADGDALPAMRQARGILRKQGLSFGHVLEMLREASEAPNHKELADENMKLGGQLREVIRENNLLRAQNDRISLIRAFGRAGKALVKTVKLPVKLYKAAKADMQKAAWIGAAAVGYTAWPLYEAITGGAPGAIVKDLAISAAVIGGARGFYGLFICDDGSAMGKHICMGGVSIAFAAVTGFAAYQLNVMNDKSVVSAEQLADQMADKGELHQKTVINNYRWGNQAKIATVFGHQYQWVPEGVMEQGKKQVFTCTMYWGTDKDVPRSAVKSEKPPVPDMTVDKPVRTDGICQGILNSMYHMGK